MLSLLFAFCMIWFIGKFLIFGVKASWGIMKLLCTVVFFPVILIGLVVGGLLYIACQGGNENFSRNGRRMMLPQRKPMR